MGQVVIRVSDDDLVAMLLQTPKIPIFGLIASYAHKFAKSRDKLVAKSPMSTHL